MSGRIKTHVGPLCGAVAFPWRQAIFEGETCLPSRRRQAPSFPGSLIHLRDRGILRRLLR